jgi:hypothetical protein
MKSLGTRIVLFNLSKKGKRFELEKEDGDIIINKKYREFIRPHEPVKNIPADYSLKAYCEVKIIFRNGW